MTSHNASVFKMTRNAGNTTAWVRSDPDGDLSLVLQNNCLHLIHGTALNVRIHDGRVDFMAGSPADLKRALLSLTDEYEAGTLAGFATEVLA
jgi:hypothetical protein